ncbi:MAG TPA: alpha/beta hydrolase [Gammaproteobacteria bacterium]|nr:alpha/beta hydrolase [Gammaproteobacteria bacterium]
MNIVERLAICGAALMAASLTPSTALAGQHQDCHVGTYRFADGSFVDIAPRDDGTLRWRLFDGKTGVLHKGSDGAWTSTLGWTKKPDGMSATFADDCGNGGIRFDGRTGQRIQFDVTDTTFVSHGVKLVGRLVMPAGANKVPVVVLIHGSEPDSALTGYYLQRMLPAVGVGAFVFDKRGTGVSGGQYTQDFSLLADDDVAAVEEARRLAGDRLGRIGFQGGSEGGWTAPLAASRIPVDFVIVCFGLAVNVMDEDQESIELQMREKGYSPEVISKALEVGRAAEALFASDFKEGFPEFDAVRAKYGKEPWFKDVRGDFSWLILSHTDDELRAMAKDFDWHTPVYYDGMETLRADKVPQLWVVGGEDYDAPSAETSMRIKSLIADRLPFTLAYYPHAEHGMTLFETGPDGTRDSTNYAPGYFAMIRDFALYGRLSGAYGDAVITYPLGRSGR